MDTWIALCFFNLIIPAAMIGFGWRFRRRPPKKIQSLFGYRTPMSMKNEQTWAFAHRYCGNLWFWSGVVALAITAVMMLAVIGQPYEVLDIVETIVMAIQLVAMIAAVPATEIALRRQFYSNGTPK